MELKFVTGGSGHGKTRWLYEFLIREAKAHPDQTYILLVPEQFTVQAGKELIDLHPDQGLINIDVVSFRRLASRVLRETGRAGSRILSESGKSLLIRKAAAQIKEDLPLLGHYLDRQGYIQELKSIFSEFAEYEISQDELERMIRETPGRGLLHEKLKDLLRLREAVEEQRGGLGGDEKKTLIQEEILGVFASCASESQILKGCTLAFDGFTGFTPTQMSAMRALMHCCRQMLVTVTIDHRVDPFGRIEEHELFAMSKRTIQALWAMAREEAAAQGTACPGPDIIAMEHAYRFPQDGMLRTLEERLMRYDRTRKDQAEMPREGGEISLHIAAGPEEEALFAARTVCDLVWRQGYQFGQIAIIAGDLPSYEHHIGRIFPACAIPFFIDQKQAPALDPCLEFLRSAMEIASSHFSYEAVMRFLRTGLAGMDRESVDRMDLYLRAVMIRSRKRWSQAWTRTTRAVDETQLTALDHLRADLMEKLTPFLEVFSGGAKKIGEYVQALKTLLETFAVEEKMARLAEELADREGHDMLMAPSEREARAEEYTVITSQVIKVLEEMQDLIGSEKVMQKDFEQILESGLAEIRIGQVPPVLDQVYVGDMLRTRLSGIRALIVVGLNDGWIPARSEKNGILSELDREYLKDLGIALAPGMKEDAYIQRFYLYRCLTRPSERLYLSCLRSCAGKAMRPSYLMKEVTGLFPGLELIDEDESGRRMHNILLPGPDMEQVARAMRDSTADAQAGPQLLEVLRFAREQELGAQVEQLCKGAFFRLGTEQLEEETARNLYGSVLEGSVTRLDQFALCPFMHFAGYGLGLKEPEEARITAADTGTLYHDALEHFAKTVTNSPDYDWYTLTQEQQEQVLMQSVQAAVGADSRDLFSDSARSRFVVERTLENLRMVVRAMVFQIQAGTFVPARFELPFRDRFGDDPAFQIGINGIIDRLDLYEDADGIYLKVVDYKTGSTSFDLPLMYDGRQLQLLVYLNEARKMLEQETGRKVYPAGIYYMHLMDPKPVAIPADKFLTGDEVDLKLLDQLRPDGLTNSDPQILKLFSQEEGRLSHVIKAPRITKEGTVHKDSPSATTRQLEALERMCRSRIRTFADQISGGMIRPVPYRDGYGEACGFCRFREACFFDSRLPGAAFREKQKMSRQEMLDLIEKEEEERGSKVD